MSKRFTATEKWDKPWYRKLPPRLKCLWQFLCDRCDQAGVIEMDWDLASFQIGEAVKPADLAAFVDQIQTLDDGKLWLKAFVEFQYGKLSATCPAHKPVIRTVQKHFGEANKIPIQYPIDREQEEEEEIDKEKEEVPETERPKPRAGSFPTLEQVIAFADTVMIRPDEAKSYWLARDGVGWVRSSNGSSVPIRNWQSDMQSYVNGQRQREAEAKAQQAKKPKQRLVC